jgi:LmbE family N-acetylglucosaminyl deacetylase
MSLSERRCSNTVILSPHSDDAALSLSLLISSGCLPTPIAIITIFSTSDWRHGGSDPSQRDLVTRLRTAEDKLFAQSMDCEIVNLGYEDAPLRQPMRPGRWFLDETEPVDDRLVESLRDSLASLPQVSKTSLVLAPSGVGGHIDHRSTAIAATKIPGVAVVRYADQPYALEMNIRCGQTQATFWRQSNDSRNRRMKRGHILHYASQPAQRRMLTLMEQNAADAPIEVAWVDTSHATS